MIRTLKFNLFNCYDISNRKVGVEMSRYSFLENEHLTRKSMSFSTSSWDPNYNCYHYENIFMDNNEYKAEIMLSTTKKTVICSFLKRKGKRDIWVAANITEAPLWLQETVKKVKDLAQERKKRILHLENLLIKDPSYPYKRKMQQIRERTNVLGIILVIALLYPLIQKLFN